MKNVFKVFCETYKTDKKEFFGGIAFIIVWAVMVYVALVIGSLE
jgi:hypothetical protein